MAKKSADTIATLKLKCSSLEQRNAELNQRVEELLSEVKDYEDWKKKNQDYLKGVEFEKFVVRWMYNHRNRFSLKIWQGDKSVPVVGYRYELHHITAAWNKYPDLIFVDDESKQAIAIECKYCFEGRRSLETRKYDDYLNFENSLSQFMGKNIRVYIMIGTRGEASNPDWLYCIPLDALKKENLELNMRDKEYQRYKIMGPNGRILYKNIPF